MIDESAISEIESKIDNKLDVSAYTEVNTNSFLSKEEFKSYSATTKIEIGEKLDKSQYNDPDYDNYYTKEETSGATQISSAFTEVNGKITTINNSLNGFKIVALTQAEYDALGTKDSKTIYFIS